MWASLVPLLVWVKNRKQELFSCIKRSILTPYFLDTINYVTCFHVTHELLWQKAIAEIRKRLHNYESASTRCLPVQVYCWWRMEVCPWHSMGEWWSRKCLQHIRCEGKHPFAILFSLCMHWIPFLINVFTGRWVSIAVISMYISQVCVILYKMGWTSTMFMWTKVITYDHSVGLRPTWMGDTVMDPLLCHLVIW